MCPAQGCGSPSGCHGGAGGAASAHTNLQVPPQVSPELWGDSVTRNLLCEGCQERGAVLPVRETFYHGHIE